MSSTKYREEARIKAVRAAHEKATTMAAELGQKIGKPWEVTEEIDTDIRGITANFGMRYKMLPMQQEESTL